MRLKRYSLVVSEHLFNEVQRTAEEEHTSIVDLLRRYIKLGLYIAKMTSNPEVQIIIRKDGREQEFKFFI